MHDVRSREKGFTLIELMISIAIISILAGITVPTLVSARSGTNESAAIATVRSISQAEYQFRSQNLVDMNGDSGFEYGTVREMTGQDPLRGSAVRIRNSLLSPSLGSLDALGRLHKNGYVFQLYLPNASGEGVAAIASNSGNIDAVLAASYWTCLAWPEKSGTTGRHTFFINQQGQILKTLSTSYSGTISTPEPGAALQGSVPKQIDSQQLAIGIPAADGNTWVAVN